MKVYLIRHTSVDVEPGVCYGQSDVALRDTFPAEAAEVVSNLDGIRFDKVFTSPLSRCTRLAEYAGYPDAERDDRLKELNFGKWEMKRFDDIDDPKLQEWYADYFYVTPTGGESAEMQHTRVKSFFSELAKQDYDTVAVFTHGGVIMQVMLMLGMVDIPTLFSHLPPYGGIVEVVLPPRTV